MVYNCIVMLHRNIRYRLYPKTRAKADLLNQCLGATRFVWNHFLAKNKTMMQAHRDDASNPLPSTTFFSLGKEFTQLRKQLEWLDRLPCAPIRYVLKYQADAWTQCFASTKGFPKFKSKHYHDDSVTFPKGLFKFNGEWLFLTGIGNMQLSGSNPYTGCEVKQVVVKKERNKYYAIVCYAVDEAQLPKVDNGKVIGIDMNVGQFATSEGQIRHMPDLEKLQARLRRYQRMMARRQKPNHKQGIKPSNRYLKAQRRAKKTSVKIRHTRSNWHHQESRKIANGNQYGVVERLNTKGMTRSAKGTAENPGKQVKAKSGLNREILKTGWHGLKQKLAYKMEVVEVDPKHTSQKCHRCGYVDKDNRKTQSRFECVGCGHLDNADINAALNILALGTRAIGRGRGDCISNLNDPSRRYRMVVNYSI